MSDRQAWSPDNTTQGANVLHYTAKENRRGIALCLSGGGFRAALYHLGALRCLNELGVLQRLECIASVSGGSILSAFLATRLSWPLPAPLTHDEWEERIAIPVRDFVSRDRRTLPLVRGLVDRRKTAVQYFAQVLQTAIGDVPLSSLPDGPHFVFCASNLTLGGLWRFERDQVGDDQIGFASPFPPLDKLCTAVAISAGFAPVFPPFLVSLDSSRFEFGRLPSNSPLRGVRRVALNDGGVYDNLGLEAVWRDYRILLVSDGGAPQIAVGRTNFPRLLGRTLHSSELNDQMGRLARRRWFILNILNRDFLGAYWGIGNSSKDHNEAFTFGYSRDLVQSRISRIRTDLNSFSRTEQAVLEYHGYTSALAAIREWGRAALNLNQFPSGQPPHSNKEWLDESLLRDALSNSHRRMNLPFSGPLRRMGKLWSLPILWR